MTPGNHGIVVFSPVNSTSAIQHHMRTIFSTKTLAVLIRSLGVANQLTYVSVSVFESIRPIYQYPVFMPNRSCTWLGAARRLRITCMSVFIKSFGNILSFLVVMSKVLKSNGNKKRADKSWSSDMTSTKDQRNIQLYYYTPKTTYHVRSQAEHSVSDQRYAMSIDIDTRSEWPRVLPLSYWNKTPESTSFRINS